MGDIPLPPTGPAPSTGGGTRGGSSGSSGGSAPSSGGSGSSGSSGSSGGSSGGSRGGGGGGGGGGGDPFGYRAKAARRYEQQARNLQMQANAIRKALDHEFGKALHIRLRNVGRVLGQQDSLVTDGYQDRVRQLAGANADNDKAVAGQTGAAKTNLIRERNSALSEAAANGAGESDIVASQLMSLRNWQAGQSEVTRSQFDTLRSENSSLTDLNVDTKSARVNLATQANADRELLWQNYFDRRSEALTQLGNIYGQQADYYESAKEYGGGGPTKKLRKKMDAAYDGAAESSGDAWKNPGVSKKLLGWDGRPEFKSVNNQSRLSSAQVTRLEHKPEGATLRSWDDE